MEKADLLVKSQMNIIRQQAETIKKKDEIIRDNQARLGEFERTLEELTRQLEWFHDQLKLSKHKQFGTSSEKNLFNQLSIFNEAEAVADELPEELEDEFVTVPEHRRKKKTRLTTDKLPDNLPIEEIEHTLPEDQCVCPECNGDLHVMGREFRDELKIIPAKASILRHVTCTYACRNCEKNSDKVPVIKSKAPEPVIKGGMPAPETLAHIAVQKYMMASPLYRLEKEWKMNGIHISRQTMSNWVIAGCQRHLLPLYTEMKELLLKHDVLHADETTVQVLKEAGKKAESKSQMWLYRTSGEAKHQIVVFEYQPDRKHKRPKDFLEGFSGFLHADGYEGYHRLPDNIVVTGCWSHMRRKFVDALRLIPEEKQKGTIAATGLGYCDRLFDLEKQFASLSHEDRHQKRQDRSKPVIEKFYEWVDGTLCLPKSVEGQALTYAVNQRQYLENYLLDGRLELSNNRAERAIKEFAIGRKNWLFKNTPSGADSSAVYYSLVATASENNMNPYEYLTWVFKNVPNLGKPGYVESITDLLPGSDSIPESVYVPASKDKEHE